MIWNDPKNVQKVIVHEQKAVTKDLLHVTPNLKFERMEVVRLFPNGTTATSIPNENTLAGVDQFYVYCDLQDFPLTIKVKLVPGEDSWGVIQDRVRIFLENLSDTLSSDHFIARSEPLKSH